MHGIKIEGCTLKTNVGRGRGGGKPFSEKLEESLLEWYYECQAKERFYHKKG